MEKKEGTTQPSLELDFSTFDNAAFVVRRIGSLELIGNRRCGFLHFLRDPRLRAKIPDLLENSILGFCILESFLLFFLSKEDHYSQCFPVPLVADLSFDPAELLNVSCCLRL